MKCWFYSPDFPSQMKARSLMIQSLFVMLILLAGSQTGFAAGASPTPLKMDIFRPMTQKIPETGKRVGGWKKWRAKRQEKRGAREYEIFATLSALMGTAGLIMIIRGFAGSFTGPLMFPLTCLLLLSGLAFGIIATRHPGWKGKPLFNLLNVIGLSLSSLGIFPVALFFLQIILILLGTRLRIWWFPF